MITYNHERIDQLVADLNSGANQLDQLKGQLAQSLQGLASHWQGSGADSWTTTQARWNSEFGDSKDLLNRLAVGVNEANDMMRTADRSSANQFLG